MTQDLVRPLDAGDGTPDEVLAGVVRCAEDLVGATNAVGQVLEEVLQRLEAVETGEDPTSEVDLQEWVGWLRRSYRLDAPITGKWMDTAGVRQELEALHAGWCAAYKTDGTPLPGTAAMSWHESLDRALERIRKHSTRDEDKNGVETPPWATTGGEPPEQS